MHRSSLVVDKSYGTLTCFSGKVMYGTKGELTAMANRPHFVVSMLKLFRLTCHPSGTTLSVAIYM